MQGIPQGLDILPVVVAETQNITVFLLMWTENKNTRRAKEDHVTKISNPEQNRN